MTIKYIIKRNGSTVSFAKIRISKAIFKAAQAVGGSDTQISLQLTEKVVQTIQENYENKTPNVEEVQDIVEKVLVEAGHAKTAKAYILYRAEKTKLREQKRKEVLEKIDKHEARVVLEDGSEVDFDSDSMLHKLEIISNDLREVDCKDLFLEACSHLYNGIYFTELEASLINAARGRIEISIDYSYLAARLLLEKIYTPVLNLSFINKKEFTQSYREFFSQYLKKGLTSGLLNNELESFDLEKIQEHLAPERDLLFQYRGLQTIHDRYLLKTTTQKQIIFELPQYFWMRVAMGLALAEKENRTEYAIDFYNSISQMDYVPSTPTLFNAGTNHPQLSSCFLNTVSDSLDGIFKSYADNAQLSKYAGGIGTDWTFVRSLGSRITGTNGNSQGVIPFLKIFNDVAVAVNQGGKRKGAMCAYLELWHGDIEEFLESKKNTGDERRRLHDVHTAVWIPDLFMKRLEQDGQWSFFSPTEVLDLHDLYGAEFEKQEESCG